MRNLLVATDFSDASARILNYATGIARRYHSRICLFHWLDPAAYSLAGPDAVACGLDAAWRDVKALEAGLHRQDPTEDLRTETLVEQAAELSEILPSMVRDQKIDLIIVGTHGRTGFKRLVLGSIAEKIFRAALCPVLTIGPHVQRPRIVTEAPETILLATDFSPASGVIDRLSISLAYQSRARLTILDLNLHCSAQPSTEALRDAWLRTRLTELQIPSENLLPRPEWIELDGPRVEGALRMAEDRKTDLIAFTVSAPYGFRTRIEETDAYRFMSEAPCPVLTAKPTP